MTRPDERRFATFQRGYVRDTIILARFRNVLRERINPDTGALFTEDEVAYITQTGSRFWIEADAIDLFGQSIQARAEWLADQLLPRRANGEFLLGHHGQLWLPDGPLPAVGGSGAVTVTGNVGATFVGSTTIGDAGATYARDPSGKRFQVLTTVAIGSDGTAQVMVAGIDGGNETNLAADTVLTWANAPVGAAPTAVVVDGFTGGYGAETHAEYAQRIEDRIRFSPGSGNSAQFVDWARQASGAVEMLFVYPCALNGGSVVVAPTQKRGSVVGPLARLPSVGVIAAVTARLVPPASPCVPEHVAVTVLPIQSVATDLIISLSMPAASSAGWDDAVPWPRMAEGSITSTATKVQSVTSATVFDILCAMDRDGVSGGTAVGLTPPSLMAWNATTSRFEVLDVASVTYVSASRWRVTLASPPTTAITTSTFISPGNARHKQVAEAVEQFFDSLGPGDLIASDDPRYARAARFPAPDIRYPTRVGQTVVPWLVAYLGGSLSDASLRVSSQSAPSVPSEVDIMDGPKLLTLGRVSILPMI